MRCSWSERLLDRYVEGTLTPRLMIDVGKHVAGCANCAALLTELRVVDALLETTKPLELPINFTFAVMADVRTTPAPRVRRFAWWMLAVAYLTLAWVIGLIVALDSNGTTRAAMTRALAPLLAEGNAMLSALGASSHALGAGSPLVTGVGFTILIADVLALGAVLYFYRNLRPRLAEQLARVSEREQP